MGASVHSSVADAHSHPAMHADAHGQHGSIHLMELMPMIYGTAWRYMDQQMHDAGMFHGAGGRGPWAPCLKRRLLQSSASLVLASQTSRGCWQEALQCSTPPLNWFPAQH